MKKNYRWGILGAGRIAEKFCEAVCFTAGTEVYAIASRDMDNAIAFGEKYQATKFYNSYLDLVNDAEVDIIYIATPHAFHYEQTLLCLQHGKHVLCEKPMSLSLQQTTEMLALAKKNNLFLMEAMWTACMPLINKITALIQAGTIGALQYVGADFGFSAPMDSESRLYNKSLGGGSIMDIGIYPIFFSTLILGEPSVIKSVSALTQTGVDEYTNVVMQYPGGQTAHLVSSFKFNTALEAEIIGSKGRIKLGSPWFKANSFSLYLNEGETTENVELPHECNGYEYEIKEALFCLDNGLLESPKMPHQQTLLISKIMEELLHQAGVKYS